MPVGDIGAKTPADVNRRELVKDIQTRLQAKGYSPGAADGMYGARTRQAIEAFQRDEGLTVDGQATPALREALAR